ncbi:hypothetical protein MNBD_ALPHA06-1074 [hydrothermal vent metagenome]|uniref:Uncharacterized protein n=1 Tax=hydrothermal vent metagenome TaxID=652676 RepID=A0A3B0RXM8_9ZZZZ
MIEKWLGRSLLAGGVLAILVLSSFAVKAIAEPDALKDPAVILGYLGAFFLVTAPLGVLGTASMIVRFHNRSNAKQNPNRAMRF